MARIGVKFQVFYYILKIEAALHNLQQRASVSKYNDQSGTLMLEVRSVMSGHVFLLAYLHDLKPAMQT